jgi:hypothetical protein
VLPKQTETAVPREANPALPDLLRPAHLLPEWWVLPVLPAAQAVHERESL